MNNPSSSEVIESFKHKWAGARISPVHHICLSSNIVDEMVKDIELAVKTERERIVGIIEGIEYCSNCCSPKKFCAKWGDSPSAVDTKELVSAIKEHD